MMEERERERGREKRNSKKIISEAKKSSLKNSNVGGGDREKMLNLQNKEKLDFASKLFFSFIVYLKRGEN